MSDFDDKLERAQADGRITTHDADEVRTFAAFLADLDGIPSGAADRTPEQKRVFAAAYREHYPDEYARAVAEVEAERPKPLCPECVQGKPQNCAGQALDPVTDELVPCATTLPGRCSCGDCTNPSFGPDTDGAPCDWCRNCGCPLSAHTTDGCVDFDSCIEAGHPQARA